MNEKELFEKLTAELNPEYVCEELLPTIRAYVSACVAEAERRARLAELQRLRWALDTSWDAVDKRIAELSSPVPEGETK